MPAVTPIVQTPPVGGLYPLGYPYHGRTTVTVSGQNNQEALQQEAEANEQQVIERSLPSGPGSRASGAT